MELNFKQKVLLSTGVITALGALGGLGAFASFTAQTGNQGNIFSNGTLVLSNTKQGGTPCLSTSAGSTNVNINNGCDQLLGLLVQKPGDSGTANITIKNEGSDAIGSLRVFESNCANSDGTESYKGTGNPCSQVQLYIQQYSDASFGTASACLYGGASALTCNFSSTTSTLQAFTTAYNSTTNGLAIGSGLAAGASAYFKIGLQLPTSTDNTFQGRLATFDLSWFAQQ